MGFGPEDAQPVEIDWNEYCIDQDQWGDRVVIHEVKGCMEQSGESDWIWNVQDAIDWANIHHEFCSLNN